MLAEAIVGWLVEAVGDRALGGMSQALLGSPDRRALIKAVDVATAAVIADVPPAYRAIAAEALRERFTEPPAVVVDARISVRDALIKGIQAQIAPLGDPNLTGTGRSFLQEINVDFPRLQVDLPAAVMRAVEQVATSKPALAPLAAQLNADALLAEVRALRTKPIGQGIAPPSERNEIFDLVDAMLRVEAIADEGARREVVRMLPLHIASAIPQHSVPRVQVLAMIRTCLAYPHGIQKLMEAIRLVESDSGAMNRLDAIASSTFPELLS